MTTFTELQISKDIVRAMDDMGWNEPTPVQVEAIPVGLQGGDMFAQAQTGTGKTGAFGAIILGRTKPGMRKPSTLVLVPTRELANQVSEELSKLAKYTGHICVPVYGGVGITPQTDKLRSGADIVVACPGRAKDLIDRNDLDLSKISIVVLDEADRMLDMGFARDLNYILARVPRKRQSLLFSATMSSDIRDLARHQMVNPRELLVSKDEPVLDLTKQYYVMAGKDDKRDALCAVLDAHGPKAIVFCRTKHGADRLMKKLFACGYSAGAIHGNVAQNKRERVLQGFKDGSIKILVATDVAARGLDIDAVDLVVNFDAPIDPDTYVHRIGRTGRAGMKGTAVTLFMPEERGMVKDIESRTGKPIDLLDIKIVHRPEMEIKRTAMPQNVCGRVPIAQGPRPATRPQYNQGTSGQPAKPRPNAQGGPRRDGRGPRRPDGNGGRGPRPSGGGSQHSNRPGPRPATGGPGGPHNQSARPMQDAQRIVKKDGKRHLQPRNAGGNRPRYSGGEARRQ